MSAGGGPGEEGSRGEVECEGATHLHAEEGPVAGLEDHARLLSSEADLHELLLELPVVTHVAHVGGVERLVPLDHLLSEDRVHVGDSLAGQITAPVHL